MIDIIIPAYNAHSTIEKTLMSILMQTIKNDVNIYIVNDCSKISYSNIIKKFDNKLKIKELNLTENMGPGYARQYGIEHSKSEYILFLDADDVLYDCFSLNNLYKIINNHDIAIGRIYDESIDQFYIHQGCLHGKLYSRKFIEKNNLYFNNSRNSEDNSFNQLCLIATSNIIYTNDIIYYYYYYQNSEAKKIYKKYELYSMKDYASNMEWAIEMAIDRNYDTLKIAKLMFNAICYLFSVYCYNINDREVQIIIDSANQLYKYYVMYGSKLSEEQKKNIYFEYVYYFIPKISLDEFINKIEKF